MADFRLILFCNFWLFINAQISSEGYSVDRIHNAMCTGVTMYERHKPKYDSIFNVCPTVNEVEQFLALGVEAQSRAFIFRQLNPELTESPQSTDLGVGIKGFLSQLWVNNPVHVQMTPYDAIATGYRAIGLYPTNVRDYLLYNGDVRFKEYQRRSEAGQRTTYAIGRIMLAQHYQIEWGLEPNKYHLTGAFKQSVKFLTSNAATMDAFIEKFGTHYRRSVVFGGMFGVDFYFPGYGTFGDTRNAIQHVMNTDIMATQNASYVAPFEGFTNHQIESSYWSIPSGSDLGIEEWEAIVAQNPVLIKEELYSITELLQASGEPNIWPILNYFDDRIAVNARRLMTVEAPCLFFECPEGFVCMGKRCVAQPAAPRWPDNIPYCVPKAVGESCPSRNSYREFTQDTWVYWDTENGPDDPAIVYRGADHITSHGLNPDQVPATLEDSQNGGIKMYYCCFKQPTTSGSERTPWPAGNYCLYAYGTLSIVSPREWSFDSIVWNDEDTDNQNDYYHNYERDVSEVPLGMYHKSYTEQKLLCRQDGECSSPIMLPKEFPFYLVRNGHCCQEVHGMFWTHVEVAWDTENNPENAADNDTVRENSWESIYRVCSDPPEDVQKCMKICKEKGNGDKRCIDVGPDKVVMDFCYYQERGTPGPTPSPTPMPTPPTRAPTTRSPTPSPPTPTMPPTPPPPTKAPTPYPTRPTPSPIRPTKSPTRSPTPAPPTPFPTPNPTRSPVVPTPPPTRSPTPSPTPSPTVCPFCNIMQTVNIVGLNSIWPNDVQPSVDVFVHVPCDCVYCEDCGVVEDCEIRYYIGDFMFLSKFWRDHPVALEPSDLVFERVTWYGNADGNDRVNTQDLSLLKAGIHLDLAHARNALLYGGSQRMQDYGKVYSIMDRYIYTNHNDRVHSAAHVVARSRKKEMLDGIRRTVPDFWELTPAFVSDAEKIIRALHFNQQDVGHKFEDFIRKFGTHYIVRATFGGMYGADFYFTGYGTKPEMIMGLRDVRNANVATSFEHNRLRELGREPSSGRSFIRNLGGTAEVGPEIKGWHYGGDPYGIRASSDHREWAKHLNANEMVVIIHHKKLASISNLLVLLPQPNYLPGLTEFDALKVNVEVYFKDKVVELAYYWLMLHYYCFFLDSACENRRRHPFLREDVGKDGCQDATVPQTWMRQRTELETCVGQEHRDSGYLLKSNSFPYEAAQWCKGAPDFNGIPSNYGPFSNSRKGNCPLVPPNPRWPNFISFCLPKPVGSLECPKEEYPDYEWNWDAMQYIIDDHSHHDLYSAVTENTIFAGFKNINPINEVYSPYPWPYELENYNPRLGDPSNAQPYATFLSTYTGDQQPIKEDCYQGVCKYRLGYVDYTLYPSNRYYIRSQAPFLQEIGWAFWDTEDSTDDRDLDMVQVATNPTPTHKAVAQQWKLVDGNWDTLMPNGEWDRYTLADRLVGGKHTDHTFVTEEASMNYPLWDTPELPSFKTGGIKMDYCCTTISEGQDVKHVHTLHWPDGHLCIYAHGAIDSTDYQFQQGSVGWDCENGPNTNPKILGNKIYTDVANNAFTDWDEVAQQQRITESLPTGLYHIQFDGQSEQYISQNLLCMKTNLDLERDIELPRDRPFYLMQYKGRCQYVRGMFYTEVQLWWYTEIDHITWWPETGTFDRQFVELEMNSWGHATAFGRRDQIPDGHYGQDYISIKYCYYQPNCKLFKDPSGPEPWYERDAARSDWVTNLAVLKEDEGMGMDIKAMDFYGTYNVPWPVNAENHLCLGPTPVPTPPTPAPTPPPSPPTPAPTKSPTDTQVNPNFNIPSPTTSPTPAPLTFTTPGG